MEVERIDRRRIKGMRERERDRQKQRSKERVRLTEAEGVSEVERTDLWCREGIKVR